MRSYKSWTTVSPIWTTSLSLAVLQDHDQHLRTLFTQLQTYGMLLIPSKYVFFVPEISFLVYKISSMGSQPLPEQVADVKDFPTPKTSIKFRHFLGILNFYWRFLPKQYPFTPLFTTFFSAPDLRVPIPSRALQDSSQLPTIVKQTWLGLLFWHTSFQPLHSPWSWMLQLPP